MNIIYQIKDGNVFSFDVTGNENFILINQTGERTSISESKNLTELSIVKGATTWDLTVHQKCLIQLKTFDTYTAGVEIMLVPIPSISQERRIAVKNENGEVTIFMPEGPEYEVGGNTFYGGDFTFTPALSDLEITVVNYFEDTHIPSLPLKINLHIVEGVVKNLEFVHTGTISDVTPLITTPSELPSFITFSSPDVTATNQPGADYDETLIVKDSADKYYQYSFTVLPNIPLTKIIYFAPGEKYKEILPSVGYGYGALDLEDDIVAGSVPFSYGELTGTFTLTQYDGNSSVEKIYLQRTLTAVSSVHLLGSSGLPKSGSEGTAVSLPYSKGGFTIQTSGLDIEVLKSHEDIQVDQFITINASNEATLVSWENVPADNHPDVYIFGSGETDWTSDVAFDVIIPAAGYSSVAAGGIFTMLPADKEVTAKKTYLSTSEYFGTSFTFRIIREHGNYVPIDLVQEKTETVIDDITGYTLTLPTMSPYHNQTQVRTEHCEITLVNKTITFKNISPEKANPTTDGKTAGGITKFAVQTADDTFVYEITTHKLPYAPRVVLELYNDGDLIFTPIANVTVTTITPSGTIVGGGNVSTGDNTIEYDYYGETGFSFTLHVKAIPAPQNVSRDKVMVLDKIEQFDVLNELPQATFGYTITTVTPSAGSILVTPSSPPYNHNQFSLTPSAVGSFTTVIDLEYNSTTSLPNKIFQLTFNIIVWDPASTDHKVAHVGLSPPGAPLVTQTFAVSGDLLKVEFNGQVLEGTKHNALDWSKYHNNFITVGSYTRSVGNYFFYSTTGVTLWSVVVVESTTATKQLKVSAPATSGTFNFLELFFGTWEDELIEAGVSHDYQVELITGLGSGSIDLKILQADLPLIAGDILLTPLNYELIQVADPSVIAGTTDFVIEINKPFLIKSSDISIDSVLSFTSSQLPLPAPPTAPTGATGRNETNGITVQFKTQNTTAPPILPETEPSGDNYETPEPYVITATLTNGGINSVAIALNFTVYDPAQAKPIHKRIYSTSTVQMFPQEVATYAIDGINHGNSDSQIVQLSSPTATTMTITVTAAVPRRIIVAHLTDGTVYIIDVEYIILMASSIKHYLLDDGVYKILSGTDVSDVNPADSPTVQWPISGTMELNGYPIFSSSGKKVGWVKNNAGTISVLGNEPGIWDNFELDVTIGTTVGKVFPYIETLAKINLIPSDTFVNINEGFHINLNNYTTTGQSYNYKNPLMNGGTLPSHTSIVNGIVSSTGFDTAGTYQFQVTVESTQESSLTDTLIFNVIVINPATTEALQIQVVEQLATSLDLEGELRTINGAIQTGTQLRISGLQLDWLKVSPYTLSIKALGVLSAPVTFDVVIHTGKKYFVTVSQVTKDKDINILANEYKGNIFKTPGRVVVSYSIGGTTYSPGQLYSLTPTGTIRIETNGDYEIRNAGTLTIVVTYNSGSGSTINTLTITVDGRSHETVFIEQSPPTTLNLGTGIIAVSVNEQPLTHGIDYDLVYALFTWNDNTLKISNVSSDFQPTLIQAEGRLASKLKISDFFVDIKRGTNEQTILEVVHNSKTTFVAPFVPIKIKYDTMEMSGADATFGIFDKTQKIGMVTISGTSINVTTFNKSGISRFLGLVDKENTAKYYVFKITDSTIETTNVNIGDSLTISDISSNLANKIESMGNLQGTSVVVGVGVLENRVKNNGSGLIILSDVIPVSSYSFYITLTDGTYKAYTIDYHTAQIYVSDLKKIPFIQFLGASYPPSQLKFQESSISISGAFVLNPNKLTRSDSNSTSLWKV